MNTEERVAKIEAMLSTLATKEDLANLRADINSQLHALTWKVIAACGGLVAATYFVATHAGQSASPPAPVTFSPAQSPAATPAPPQPGKP